MSYTITNFNLTPIQLKGMWEDLKRINASQKIKNTWKKAQGLETAGAERGSKFRLMTNREVEEYFSDY